MRKNRINNNGFSLVELIVTVLVTSLLMLGVIAFMSTSRSAYQIVSTNATLQEESFTTERVIGELLKEAKAYGFDEDVDVDTGSKKHKGDVLWVVARDNNSASYKDYVYFFVFDKVDNKLRYCMGENDKTNPKVKTESGVVNSVQASGISFINSECYGTNAKFSLIADHITDVSFVLSPDGSDLAVANITYDYNGKTYTNTLTATTRNRNTKPASPAPTGGA